MKKHVPPVLKRTFRNLIWPLPQHLSRNQIEVDGHSLKLIRLSLEENFHTGWRAEPNFSKETYAKDLNAHLMVRLQSDRRIIIPWLDSIRRLRGQRILEIGCGTGSSTVALAEQGANVTGIDIDEGALRVAEDRCKVYKVQADLLKLNCKDIANVFAPNSFDSIIFFACLEHMTVEERLTALRTVWEMLPSGGLLIVIETPNRLWYFDSHTSVLPFFHWLPDDLAFQYSRFSPRKNFADLYREYSVSSMEHFLRRGRGMSFHEFDIAIRPVQDLKVVSSLAGFRGMMGRLLKSRSARQYKKILKASYPAIHEGFFEMMLDLVIEKS